MADHFGGGEILHEWHYDDGQHAGTARLVRHETLPQSTRVLWCDSKLDATSPANWHGAGPVWASELLKAAMIQLWKTRRSVDAKEG